MVLNHIPLSDACVPSRCPLSTNLRRDPGWLLYSGRSISKCQQLHSWRLQSIRRSLCPQNCCAANTTINNSYFLKWPTALFLLSQSRRMRNTAVNHLAIVYLSSLAPLTAASKWGGILRLSGSYSTPLVAAIDGQSTTLVPTVLMKSALDDPGRPPQVAVAVTSRNGRSVISLARKTSMEYHTIGYNWVSRWCQNLK